MDQQSTFSHIGFVVSNYKVCRDFFTEALGFQVVKEWEGKLPGSQLAMLRLGDAGTELELLSFPTVYRPPQSHDLYEPGFRHLGIGVEDVVGATEKLRRLGYKVIVEPGPGKIYSLYSFVQGPEGILIELVQEPEDPASSGQSQEKEKKS